MSRTGLELFFLLYVSQLKWAQLENVNSFVASFHLRYWNKVRCNAMTRTAVSKSSVNGQPDNVLFKVKKFKSKSYINTLEYSQVIKQDLLMDHS